MKEKILKLFFEEETILIPNDECFDKKEQEYEIKTEEVHAVCDLLKVILGLFSLFYVYKVGMSLSFPTEPFTYGLMHDIALGIMLVISFNFLIDYFYIKEMCKVSVRNIDKKLIKKTKSVFISVILIMLLGIFSLSYDIIQIIQTNNYIYYLISLLVVLLIVLSFVVSVKLINYIFKQIDILKKETDGIV